MKSIARFSLFIIITTLATGMVAQENRLQIVATHSILGDVVSHVAGDVADVIITMPPGADPHGFQPVPGDLVALADADVVFINGAFFEEGLLEAIENASDNMNIVTVSACIDMLSFEDEHEDENPEGGVSGFMTELCFQHYDEIGYSAPEFETIGTLYAIDCNAGCDPHVWMIPENVKLWTLLIRDTLIELDPDNSETYASNADTYLAALDELNNDFIAPMIDTVPVEQRLLVTNHDSMAYFAAEYGFEIASTVIPGGGTLAEPGAAEMVVTINLIRERGVGAIFAENSVSSDIIEQISEETGAELFTLYSGSLSADDVASTYLDYMRYNVTTIVEALDGES